MSLVETRANTECKTRPTRLVVPQQCRWLKQWGHSPLLLNMMFSGTSAMSLVETGDGQVSSSIYGLVVPQQCRWLK
jgi:hypothetical protein